MTSGRCHDSERGNDTHYIIGGKIQQEGHFTAQGHPQLLHGFPPLLERGNRDLELRKCEAPPCLQKRFQ